MLGLWRIRQGADKIGSLSSRPTPHRRQLIFNRGRVVPTALCDPRHRVQTSHGGIQIRFRTRIVIDFGLEGGQDKLSRESVNSFVSGNESG